MQTSKILGFIGLMVLAAIIISSLGFGYFSGQDAMEDSSAAAAAPVVLADAKSVETQIQEAGAAMKAEAAPAEAAPTFDASALAPSVFDITKGNPKAPVTLVEYASLSCPHCAHVTLEIMPEITKKWVDTGKVFFVYRHFPLNAPAMKAAMAVECAPDEKKMAVLNALYAAQRDWAFEGTYATKIQKIARDYGLESETLKACFADTNLENRLLATRQTAENKLQVTSTPTLFIAGERYNGGLNTEGISAAIQSAVLVAETPEKN
jgi:protein-disulfide isomerase